MVGVAGFEPATPRPERGALPGGSFVFRAFGAREARSTEVQRERPHAFAPRKSVEVLAICLLSKSWTMVPLVKSLICWRAQGGSTSDLCLKEDLEPRLWPRAFSIHLIAFHLIVFADTWRIQAKSALA